MLAQQALEAVAGKLPRQPAFRMLLDTLRKEQQDGTGEAPIVQGRTAAPSDTTNFHRQAVGSTSIHSQR